MIPFEIAVLILSICGMLFCAFSFGVRVGGKREHDWHCEAARRSGTDREEQA